ncbi:hypothetical protein Tco_0405512 [Tanacetum coccineum]
MRTQKRDTGNQEQNNLKNEIEEMSPSIASPKVILTDHHKIFESRPLLNTGLNPCVANMFTIPLVGNALNCQQTPRRSIDGFEELRRAFRLNFTQRKKCAKNPVELARVKQRQGESTSAYEKSRRQSNDQSGSRNNSYCGQRGGQGNDKYTPLTMTPKEILATEGANFPRPPPMRTPEEQRVGNGYCEYHRQKGHTTNECVQLRQLIDKLVKEGRLDPSKEHQGREQNKLRAESKKDAPRDNATDTIIIWCSHGSEKPKQKRAAKNFSHMESGISFPFNCGQRSSGAT